MSLSYSVIGKRVPRVDGSEKATGQARFTADLSLPGMLHGKLLRSPHPHARVLHVDASGAEKLPGVRAVVTARDFGNFKYGFLPTTRDEAPLAIDKVRFIGDEVAAVAAIDPEIAAAAVELIKIDYELLPAVFDPEEALKEGAPRIHDQVERNLSARCDMNFGDVEKGFRESDHIREDRFCTQPVLHGFIEPHAALAEWDLSGRLVIWASKQSPYFLYRNLSTAFNLPLHKVRVIQPCVGGGFGGKNESFALDFSAAMLAKKSGKPVKIVLTQEEVLAFARRRHPMILRLKTGVKRDGTLVASHCKVIADGGAYASVGPLTIYLAGVFMTLPYVLRNVKYEAYRAYTNKPVSVAQRGNGIPQIRFAAECQLDLIARDLGMDPLEIRLKNACGPGYVTANNLKVTSCGLRESIERVAAMVERPEKEAGEILRGTGFASNAFPSGGRLRGHNSAGAVVKVHEDGGVSLLTGSTDSGQGSQTVLAMIVAEELGIGLDMVTVSRVDSEVTPVDPGTYGSRVTMIAGNAAKRAAAEAKKILAQVAAEALEADLRDIIFKEGKVFVAGSEDRAIPFSRLARMAYYQGGGGTGQTVLGQATYAQELDIPDWEKGTGNLAAAYSFGTQAAQVEVNKKTGEVKVTRMWLAHDCGNALNPLGVEGQLEGSMYGGLGQALFEKLVIDESCQTLNPSFLDYRMPLAPDVPEMVARPIITMDSEGPFGAKEAGEGTQVSTVPCIINAIYNATGVMIKELPIRPEKVLKALEEKDK